MPLFPGPAAQANEKFLINLARGGSQIARFAPPKEQEDSFAEQVEIQKMRSFLANNVIKQQMQETRQGLIDQGILTNRSVNPPTPQQLNLRDTKRLTIQEINRMTPDNLRQQIEKMGQNQMGDQRSAAIKFLDLIDLPRNSIFNIAFTDEGEVDDALAGGGLMAGLGAAIFGVAGAIGGSAVAPGVGTVAGAVAGAAKGAAWGAGVGALAYGGSLGVASLIGTSLDEEEKRQIRIESQKDHSAARERPRVYFSQVLDKMGIESGVKRALLGFGGDVLLDPLSYITGGGQVAKWGLKGTGLAAANTAVKTVNANGIAFVKNFTKLAAKQGRIDDAGKLVLPDGHQYKSLEDLFNHSVMINDDVYANLAKVHDIGPGLDRAKRLQDATAGINKATAARATGTKLTGKEIKTIRNKIFESVRDDMLFFENITKIEKGTDAFKLGEISRDFFRRFQAGSTYQTHLPFMDWIHPLFRRKVGYSNLGIVNIPVFRGDRIGVAKRALGKTDELFLQAENLKRGERLARISRDLGKYNGARLFIPTGAVPIASKIMKIEQSLPEAIRAKLVQSRDGIVNRELLSGKAKQQKRAQTGLYVNINELTGDEFDYLLRRGDFIPDHPIDSPWNPEALSKNLHGREELRIKKLHEESIAIADEGAHLTQAEDIARVRLEAAENNDARIRELLDLGTDPLPKDITPELRALGQKTLKEVAKATAELKNILQRKDLTTDMARNLLSKETSALLDAVDGVRGAEYGGEAIGVFGGPGFLGKLMRGFNQKTHDLQNKIQTVNKEYDLVVQRVRKSQRDAMDQVADPRLNQELAALTNALEEAQQELNALLPKIEDVGEDVQAAAANIVNKFGLTAEDADNIAVLIDSIASAVAKRSKGVITKEAWVKEHFSTVARGKGKPKGPESQVYFQSSARVSKETQKNYGFFTGLDARLRDAVRTPGMFINTKRNIDHLGDGIDKIKKALSEITGETPILETGGRLTRDKAGKFRSTFITKFASLATTDPKIAIANSEYAAIQLALASGESRVSIFTPSKSGKQHLITANVGGASSAQRISRGVGAWIREIANKKGRHPDEIKYIIENSFSVHTSHDPNAVINVVSKNRHETKSLKKYLLKEGATDVKIEKGNYKEIGSKFEAKKGYTEKESREIYQRNLIWEAEKRIEDGATPISGNDLSGHLSHQLDLPLNEQSWAVSRVGESIRALGESNWNKDPITGIGRPAKGREWYEILTNPTNKQLKFIDSVADWQHRTGRKSHPISADELKTLGIFHTLIGNPLNARSTISPERILRSLDTEFTIYLDRIDDVSIIESRNNLIIEKGKRIQRLHEDFQTNDFSEIDRILGGRRESPLSQEVYGIVSRLKGEFTEALPLLYGKNFGIQLLNQAPNDIREILRPLTSINDKLDHTISAVLKKERWLKHELSNTDNLRLLKTLTRMHRGVLEEERILKTSLDIRSIQRDSRRWSNLSESEFDNKIFLLRNSDPAADFAPQTIHHGQHFPNQPDSNGSFRTSDHYDEITGGRILSVEEAQHDAVNQARYIKNETVYRLAYHHKIKLESNQTLENALRKSGKLTEDQEKYLDFNGYYSDDIWDWLVSSNKEDLRILEFDEAAIIPYKLSKLPTEMPGYADDVWQKAGIRRLIQWAINGDGGKPYSEITSSNGILLDMAEAGMWSPATREKNPFINAIYEARKQMGMNEVEDLGISIGWTSKGTGRDRTINFQVKRHDGKIKPIWATPLKMYEKRQYERGINSFIYKLKSKLGTGSDRINDLLFHKTRGILHGEVDASGWIPVSSYYNTGLEKAYSQKNGKLTRMISRIADEVSGGKFTQTTKNRRILRPFRNKNHETLHSWFPSVQTFAPEIKDTTLGVSRTLPRHINADPSSINVQQLKYFIEETPLRSEFQRIGYRGVIDTHWSWYENMVNESGIRFNNNGHVVPEDFGKWAEIVDTVSSSIRQKRSGVVADDHNDLLADAFLEFLGFQDPKYRATHNTWDFGIAPGRHINRNIERLWHTEKGIQRASVEFTTSGGTIIRALDSPDLGSFIHEMGHILRRTLHPTDLNKVAKRLGVVDVEDWSVEAEEAFANMVMDFLMKGEAPTPGLQVAFDGIADVMNKIYDKNYDGPINGNLRRSLDNVFGATPEGLVRAKRYREVRDKIPGIENKQQKILGEVDELEGDIANFRKIQETAKIEHDKVAKPLRDELDARKKSLGHGVATKLENADRVIRNATGVGRRGQPAGEAVQGLRHGMENVAAFRKQIVVKEFDGKVSEFAKKYEMAEEDAHAILLAKIMEKEEVGLGRRNYHPSDILVDDAHEGSINNIMAKYGGRDRVWNDKSLNDMAQKISDMHKEFGLKEAAMKVDEVVDPSWGYAPLRLTSEAQKAVWRQQQLARSAAGAKGATVGFDEPFTMTRATNRHFYPISNAENAHWVDESGQGWDFVWSADIQSGSLPAEYEMYRRTYLRQNPGKMEAGDIFDYNSRIRDRSKHIPGGREKGKRWQPDGYATSPYELNRPEMRDRFNKMVGGEFGDAIWETDLMLALGGRTQQHWRMSAVNDFVQHIIPEMKVLSGDDIANYITNPRGGMSATSVGGEVQINGVSYRRLDQQVRSNPTLRTLFGKNARNMWYPEDVASALDDYMRRITDDKNLTAIGNIFDYVQSIWKGSVLMNPAWSTVNILGGIIHSVVVGRLTPLDFAEHFGTARKMAHEFHFGNRRAGIVPSGRGFAFNDANTYTVGGEVLNETEMVGHLVKLNAIDGSQSAREMMMLHRTAFGNPNAEAKKSIMDIVRYIATMGPMGAWWFKFNASIDDTFRTTVYLARRAKGDTIDQAALLMKKAHFDYGDFTRYEESIGRRVIPFYAWQRNNIALQAKLLFERPGYVNMYHKIKHAVEEEGLNEESKVPVHMLPRWLKNQIMIQLSGDDGKAKGLVIGNLTPIQELIEIGQTIYGQEGFSEMVNYFIGSSSPILKSVFEAGTGRQVFDGREIGDPDMGEKSLTDYMLDQIGYYKSWEGLNKAATRDGLEGFLMRLFVRGRWQPLDVDRLQAQISIEKSEEIKKLRRSINRAMKDGDDERAMRIAERIIDTYRVMYNSGLKERVPKELHPRFLRENIGMKREGLTPPGSNIPQQPSYR